MPTYRHLPSPNNINTKQVLLLGELRGWSYTVKYMFLPTCLEGKYGVRLRKFSNTSYVMFRVEKVKLVQGGIGRFSLSNYYCITLEKIKHHNMPPVAINSNFEPRSSDNYVFMHLLYFHLFGLHSIMKVVYKVLESVIPLSVIPHILGVYTSTDCWHHVCIGALWSSNTALITNFKVNDTSFSETNVPDQRPKSNAATSYKAVPDISPCVTSGGLGAK